MREAQMESHTVRSHGATLARTHRHDWFILILLMALVVLLNLIHPFKRFVGKDMMDDLKYPLKDNTIPVWAVPVYAVLLPIIVFLFFYSRRQDVYDLHHAILGILYSVLVTGVITDAIKIAVGRPRPDFFWRCFPDGKDAYDHWGNVICHGAKNVLKEGHKSFPSGHTSWSFAGLGFLSLYLAGKIRAFDSRGHVAKLCVVFLPLIAACLVAISRVDDYRHHWQDVFAGGLIVLEFLQVLWSLHFATCSSSHHHIIWMVGRLMHTSGLSRNHAHIFDQTMTLTETIVRTWMFEQQTRGTTTTTTTHSWKCLKKSKMLNLEEGS